MPSTIERVRSYITHERRAAAMYRRLAASTKGPEAKQLNWLADGEEQHAKYWEHVLESLGAGVECHETPRLNFLAWLAVTLGQRFGVAAAMPLLERHEGREQAAYEDEPLADRELLREEVEHSDALTQLAPGWRETVANPVRAGIFGFSDGVVSNLALVLGVFGAGQERGDVVTAGIAGLVAGAMSMGVGEYVSVASQTEILDAHGEGQEARREGLIAAASSFLTFATGASIPLLPFFFRGGVLAALLALGLTGIALLTTGAGLSLLTLKPAWRPALRQLALGWGAAGATYVVGSLIGG